MSTKQTRLRFLWPLLLLSLFAAGWTGAQGYIQLSQIKGGTSANIPISDGTKLVSRALSGDVTVGSTGVTAIGATKVTYGMLNSTAQPGFAVELMNVDAPSGTGVLSYEFTVPAAPDGTSATWTNTKVYFRTSTTSSSGNPTINIQRSTGSGIFSNAGNLLTSNLAITAGNYENSSTGFSQSTCATGDKIKVNVVTTGTSTAGWSVILLVRRTA